MPSLLVQQIAEAAPGKNVTRRKATLRTLVTLAQIGAWGVQGCGAMTAIYCLRVGFLEDLLGHGMAVACRRGPVWLAVPIVLLLASQALVQALPRPEKSTPIPTTEIKRGRAA